MFSLKGHLVYDSARGIFKNSKEKITKIELILLGLIIYFFLFLGMYIFPTFSFVTKRGKFCRAGLL